MGRMKLLSNIINNATNQVQGFCVIKSVQMRTNVKGSEYLDFTLSDAEGSINAKLWDYSADAHGKYEAGEIIKVRGTVNMFRDTEQLKIERIRHKNDNDNVDLSELVESAPIDSEHYYNEIYAFAENFKNTELSHLTTYLLIENKEKLLHYPAALKLHHAGRGGLMYHTGTMLSAAKKLVEIYSELYPELCAELVYTGIILHDIAKTRELEVGELGLATAYSTEGQLLGHIALGVSMVQKAAEEIGISQKVTSLVSHILLSHHSIPDYGSPKPPMFPEAELVADIDMLDARMYEMFDALGSTELGSFSERRWDLDNRQLYRHGLIFDEN